MQTVNIDGTEVPFKLTNRAKRRFEKRKKLSIASMEANFDNYTELALEAINEGIAISGEGSKFSIDALLDADAKAESSPIDFVLERINDTEGKPEASTSEA